VVTFLAAEHHRRLASAKLYRLPGAVLDSAVGETRTRHLVIDYESDARHLKSPIFGSMVTKILFIWTSSLEQSANGPHG